MMPFIEDDYSLGTFQRKISRLWSFFLTIDIFYEPTKRSGPIPSFWIRKKYKDSSPTKMSFDQAFYAEVVYSLSMKIDVAQNFIGLGERALYLYSEIETNEVVKKRLYLGSTCYLTIWNNGKKVYHNHMAKRAWPMAYAAELDLRKGKNMLLIGLDVKLEDFRIKIGLKEHGNKHYHQSHWETDQQFYMMDGL